MSGRTLVSFDWALKHLLRDKANFGVLEGVLSALLNDRITVNSVLESESNRENEMLKYNRVDLLVENGHGELCIIELQYEYEAHYFARLLFGASRCIVDHLGIGQEYSNVRKVISVSILYFLLGEGEDDYVYRGTTEFYGLHSHTRLELKPRTLAALQDGCDPARHVNIFPEYYLIEVERFTDLIRNPLDEWIYFFKHSEIKPEFAAPGIQEAGEKLDYLKLPDTEKQAYRRYRENLASERDVITSAHQEGYMEGVQETARNLLKEGVDPELVARVTGLSVTKVHALASENTDDFPE